jgi:hypothetical protein
MRFAGAWSKSKASFAVQHAPTRKMQFPVPVPGGHPECFAAADEAELELPTETS